MTTSPARAARPQRAPAPPLDAFEVLDQTHRDLLDRLTRLAGLIDHVERNGVDDTARTDAREIHTFFAGHARQHHADEESHVFPPLLNGDRPDLVQHVRRLQQDHGWLEEDWIELAPQLQAVAEGYSWVDLDNLRRSVAVFTELYRDHVALEESLIYPEAKRRRAVFEAGVRDRSG